MSAGLESVEEVYMCVPSRIMIQVSLKRLNGGNMLSIRIGINLSGCGVRSPYPLRGKPIC